MNWILLGIGTVLSILFIIMMFAGGKYDYMTESLQGDDFPCKGLYVVGLKWQDFGFAGLKGKIGDTLRENSKMLYSKQYSEFYARIVWAQIITFLHLILAVFCLLAGMTSKSISTFYLLVGIVAATLAVYYFYSSFGEKIKKRQEMCEEEFPNVISKLALIVNSGVILHDSWEMVSYGKEGEIYDLMSQEKDIDIRGDVYEYLLSKIATAGRNGQFRTPRHIIRMIVELMKPQPNEIICDPACGTSGFLVTASEYLRENFKEEIYFDRQKKDHYMNHMFYGYDMDRTMLRIGAMNMMTHGVESPYIEYRDSLSDQNPDRDKYSLILANPPFKGSLDADSVSADLLKVCKTKKTELLFLALFLKMLKVGGRCACIVPDGVLFGSSKAHKAIRKELIENNKLEAVISMPSGVFKPYAGVSTGILIFTKTNHGGTDNVWFYNMTADGYSLDDKRTKVSENDIPDIIQRFNALDNEKERKRTDKSFFVTKKEIVENDYDLSINKYKEIEYEKIEYPPTKDIMKEILEINNEIAKELKELSDLLED